jgi:hypothetical protein
MEKHQEIVYVIELANERESKRMTQYSQAR